MFATRFSAFVIAAFFAFPVQAKLPVRNMTVELRVVSQAALDSANRMEPDGGYVVRSVAPQDAAPSIQKVFVMNGEKSQMKLGFNAPMQWTKTAVTPPASSSSSGVSGMENSTLWMESSQGLVVQVRWPGGKQQAVVELEVESAGIEDAHPQKSLPNQARQRIATTVITPLGVWATIAVTGRRAAVEQSGVYGSSRLDDGEQAKLVQVRVLAP